MGNELQHASNSGNRNVTGGNSIDKEGNSTGDISGLLGQLVQEGARAYAGTENSNAKNNEPTSNGKPPDAGQLTNILGQLVQEGARAYAGADDSKAKNNEQTSSGKPPDAGQLTNILGQLVQESARAYAGAGNSNAKNNEPTSSGKPLDASQLTNLLGQLGISGTNDSNQSSKTSGDNQTSGLSGKSAQEIGNNILGQLIQEGARAYGGAGNTSGKENPAKSSGELPISELLGKLIQEGTRAYGSNSETNIGSNKIPLTSTVTEPELYPKLPDNLFPSSASNESKPTTKTNGDGQISEMQGKFVQGGARASVNKSKDISEKDSAPSTGTDIGGDNIISQLPEDIFQDGGKSNRKDKVPSASKQTSSDSGISDFLGKSAQGIGSNILGQLIQEGARAYGGGGSGSSAGNATGTSGGKSSTGSNQSSGGNSTFDVLGIGGKAFGNNPLAQLAFDGARTYIDKQASDNPNNQNLQSLSNNVNLVAGGFKVVNVWNALSKLKQNIEKGQFLNQETAGAALTIANAWPEITRMVTFLSDKDGVDWSKILAAIQQQISAPGGADLSGIMRELQSQMNRFPGK